MSSAEETYISVDGKSTPVKALAVTEFSKLVKEGETYSQNSRTYAVKAKHWFLSPDGQIVGVGLATETA